MTATVVSVERDGVDITVWVVYDDGKEQSKEALRFAGNQVWTSDDIRSAITQRLTALSSRAAVDTDLKTLLNEVITWP